MTCVVGCTLAEAEQRHILAVLRVCDGNRTRAAMTLEISVRCLRNKLRAYRQAGIVILESTGKANAVGSQARNCVQFHDEKIMC